MLNVGNEIILKLVQFMDVTKECYIRYEFSLSLVEKDILYVRE